MRLTLAGAPGSPDVDLVVPDDARLGDLRARLAAATGRPELAERSTVLAVDETILDDDQLTGQVPLLAGTVLRVGAGPADLARAALRAPWHLAVVAGPDCGALVAVGAVVVGRGEGLAIDDVGISRRHLALSLGRSGPLARDLGSSNGTVLLRAGRGRGRNQPPRARRLGRGRGIGLGLGLGLGRVLGRVRGRAVRLRAGDRLAIGATVLEVRRGGFDRRDHAPTGAAGVDGTAVATGADRRPAGQRAPALATWFGPAAGSLVLAMSTGNRLLLAFALVGPAVALWPALRARTGGPRVPRAGAGPSPADELVAVSPADLATDVLRASSGPTPVDEPVPRGIAGLRALAPDGCLAVVGPRPLAVASTRALVAAASHPGPGPDTAATRVVVRTSPDRAGDWAWCRWLESTGEGPGKSPHELIVSDGPRGDGQTADLARRWASGRGATLLLIEADRALVPPWCRTVLTVRSGSGVATLELPAGTRRTLPLRAVSAAWAETYARRVAAVRQLPRPRGPTSAPPEPLAIPARVALADLPGLPAPAAATIAAGWSARRRATADNLDACLGLGPGGAPVMVDLARDGPHALVAGTTGAGKSGLLQSWLLALALTHSPADLAIALVDYKGGASFGVCSDLPHVVGQVTDLDPALAARALSGLRAELSRRERALASAGVGDLATLRARRAGVPRTSGEPAPPPRLLVVVDEFRALTEDLPSFVPGLLRLAAQGRSLGIHLVLATQRPAGAVGPELRANLALRIALRVTDAADSLDVIDSPDAARIPAALPGRAILRRGAGPPEPVQIAQADGAGVGRAGGVRIAASWVPDPGSGWLTAAVADDEPSEPSGGYARALVDAARAAAVLAGIPRPDPPWLPPLPDRVDAADLDLTETVPAGSARPATAAPATARPANAAPANAAPAGLPLALADVPSEQRRAVVGWDPTAGNLLVLGASGSGRSTTLRAVTVAALGRGWHVHAVGLPARLLADLADHPGLGTVVGPDDPRRLARLITVLGAQPSPGRAAGLATVADADADSTDVADAKHLLVIDGLDTALESLGRIARGAGAERLVELLRAGYGRGIGVIAAAGGSVPGPVAALFTERLVLAVGDRMTEIVAGVPTELAGSRRGPGRAILLPSPGAGSGRSGALLCQVAVAGALPVRPGGPVTATGPRRRISPLPDRVGRSALAAAEQALSSRKTAGAGDGPGDRRATGPGDGLGFCPAIGLGGDDAGAVRLELSRGALVIGPPGSGRSTALAVIGEAVLRIGRPIVVVARDGPLRHLGDARSPGTTCGFEPGAIALTVGAAPPGSVVLVDDLDALEQQHPAAGDPLAALVARSGGTRGPVLVAAASTGRGSTAYRGALGALRAVRTGVILAPSEPGSGEVLGVGLDWVIDPARPHAPGRGARQHGGDVVAVQVLDPHLP